MAVRMIGMAVRITAKTGRAVQALGRRRACRAEAEAEAYLSALSFGRNARGFKADVDRR